MGIFFIRFKSQRVMSCVLFHVIGFEAPNTALTHKSKQNRQKQHKRSHPQHHLYQTESYENYYSQIPSSKDSTAITQQGK